MQQKIWKGRIFMKEITVRDLYKKTKDFENKDITIEGWVKGLMTELSLKMYKLFLTILFLILKK